MTPRAPHTNSVPFSSTPVWALFATFTIAPFAGVAATLQTADLACRHHTIDACIPVFEALFGVVVTCVVVAWLASSNRRHRSITSGLKVASAATVTWLAAMATIGQLICPDPNANDVVCPVALPFGVAVFVVVGATAWRLQERIESTDPRPELDTE